jgi:hypothetical protein
MADGCRVAFDARLVCLFAPRSALCATAGYVVALHAHTVLVTAAVTARVLMQKDVLPCSASATVCSLQEARVAAGGRV